MSQTFFYFLVQHVGRQKKTQPHDTKSGADRDVKNLRRLMGAAQTFWKKQPSGLIRTKKIYCPYNTGAALHQYFVDKHKHKAKSDAERLKSSAKRVKCGRTPRRGLYAKAYQLKTPATMEVSLVNYEHLHPFSSDLGFHTRYQTNPSATGLGIPMDP